MVTRTKSAAKAAPAKKSATPGKATPAKRAPAAKKPASKVGTRVTGASRAGVNPAVRTEDLVGRASQNTLAATPLISIQMDDLKRAAGIFGRAMLLKPSTALSHLSRFGVELKAIANGTSPIQGDLKDKRFADVAWQTSPIHKRILQAYVATGRGLNDFVDESDLDEQDKGRVKFVLSLVLDGIAPSNTLLNPAALKKLVDTGGKSLVDGLSNLIQDVKEGRGTPAMVDTSGFKVGVNLATSKGAVVFKNEVLELIQYTPTTDKVYRRPVVYVSPQVNKYYAIDLTPDRSLIKWIVDGGSQLFVVSWRNPTAEHRDWGFDTYITALHDAVNAARQITGSEDVNMFGSCSGGMTMSAYLGWLAATGNTMVKTASFCVCVIDMSGTTDTTTGLFITDASVKAIKAKVAKKGFVAGSEMASMFAWLRANDLVWNYWINNYLLGNKPPAFDILFWNGDTTRLPAKYHGELLEMFQHNPMMESNKVVIKGVPIDLNKVNLEAYVLGGLTDHITPWEGCYKTARVYGDNSTFVMSNSGHLQSLINAPGNPKSWFITGPSKVENAKDWAQTATKVEGSWWPHWREWISTRSDEQVDAPRKLGSKKYPAGTPAPGTYVFEA